jgi:hypothetical protein
MANPMMTGDQWREFGRSGPVRTAMFVVGMLLMLLSPIAGAIPGPGGLFVFAAGLALTLKTSDWAKRQYVKFKRWQPKAGHWMDWGLQRRSAKRRQAIRKVQEAANEVRRQRRRGRTGGSIKAAYWLRQNLRPVYRMLQRRRRRRRQSNQAFLAKLTGSGPRQIGGQTN